MTSTAPRSSAIASAVRKTFSAIGTRDPRRAMMPSAKAMSVAIGTPHPRDPGPLAFSDA
jgi:hypothetical protein